jgi:hypothetical protein
MLEGDVCRYTRPGPSPRVSRCLDPPVATVAAGVTGRRPRGRPEILNQSEQQTLPQLRTLRSSTTRILAVTPRM